MDEKLTLLSQERLKKDRKFLGLVCNWVKLVGRVYNFYFSFLWIGDQDYYLLLLVLELCEIPSQMFQDFTILLAGPIYSINKSECLYLLNIDITQPK